MSYGAGSEKKIDPCDSRTDSGFLSGTINSETMISGEIQPEESRQEKMSTPQPRDRPDSKIESKSKDDYMRLDSGVDLVSDQMSDLCIDEDHPVPSVQISLTDQEETTWQLYFQQDDEGDTRGFLLCFGLHADRLITNLGNSFAGECRANNECLSVDSRFSDSPNRRANSEKRSAVGNLLPLPRTPGVESVELYNNRRYTRTTNAAIVAYNCSAETALHLAVLTRQPRIIRRLIVAGADPCEVDRNGNTALHLAACSGDALCVKELTDKIAPHEVAAAQLRYTPPAQRKIHSFADMVNYEALHARRQWFSVSTWQLDSTALILIRYNAAIRARYASRFSHGLQTVDSVAGFPKRCN
ncbi:unnamed protein product, partial [Nesidiocoris tenuis]